MDMEATLQRVVTHLSGDLLVNEAQVKQAVILQVLRRLGWDDADPNSIRPEYATEGGLVDYALLANGQPRVFVKFVEAKHTGAISTDGKEHFFHCAAHQGVPLLVLTDGNVWALYLSMAAGPPSQRCCYETALLGQKDLQECAEAFGNLLKRERVLSGKAKEEAELRHRQVRTALKAKEAIESAWSKLLVAPDELLRDLLVETVQTDSGIKLDPGYVETFLQRMASPPDLPPKPPEPKPKPPAGNGPPKPNAKRKLVGFELNGQQILAGTAIATLIRLIQVFDGHPGTFMEQFSKMTKSKTRQLVARNRGELYDNKGHDWTDEHSRRLANGWWIGTNLSKAQIRDHIMTACSAAGVTYGSQLRLIER